MRSKWSEVATTSYTLISQVWYRLTNLKTFAGQVGLTMATNLIIAALGIVMGILSARLLGPQGRGELATIQLWPTFIAAFGMLGMPEAVLYFASRAPERAGRVSDVSSQTTVNLEVYVRPCMKFLRCEMIELIGFVRQGL